MCCGADRPTGTGRNASSGKSRLKHAPALDTLGRGADSIGGAGVERSVVVGVAEYPQLRPGRSVGAFTELLVGWIHGDRLQGCYSGTGEARAGSLPIPAGPLCFNPGRSEYPSLDLCLHDRTHGDDGVVVGRPEDVLVIRGRVAQASREQPERIDRPHVEHALVEGTYAQVVAVGLECVGEIHQVVPAETRDVQRGAVDVPVCLSECRILGDRGVLDGRRSRPVGDLEGVLVIARRRELREVER